MKPYRLLRNNKETGPYSAEELIAMGLKAYDLVWVAGKSAAWRYPCEIAELKPYAPEAEDLATSLWKPPASKDHGAPASAQGNTPEKVQPVTAHEHESPAPKPRIRVRADWRKLEEAKSAPVHAENSMTPAPGAPSVQVTTAPPAGNSTVGKIDNTETGAHQSMPQSNENKTRPGTLVRIATGTTEALKDEKSEPQVKYSESLEDIKQRYNETILQRKRPALTSRNGLLLLLVPALCIGMWIGSGWTRDKHPKTQTAIAGNTPTQQQPQAASLQSVMADETEANEETAPAHTDAAETAAHNETATQAPAVQAATPSEPTSANHTPANATVATPAHQVTAAGPATKPGAPAKAIQPDVTPAVKPATNQVVTGKPAVTPQATTGQHTTIAGLKVQNAAETAGTTQGKATPQTAAAQPAADKANAKDGQPAPAQAAAPATQPQHVAKSSPAVSLSKKQITDYVSVEEELRQVANGKEMKLHVKNITDIPVDLVVLDLQYYDGNGKFKKGETLYVNHLSANDAVALMAPTVKNAQRIDYKVSLLSIEKNGVYLIAE